MTVGREPDDSVPTAKVGNSPLLTDDSIGALVARLSSLKGDHGHTYCWYRDGLKHFLAAQDREALAEVICDTLEAGDHNELTFRDARAVVAALLGDADA